MSVLEYKGFHTIAHYVPEDGAYTGKIEDIKDLVTFHAEKFENIEIEFRKAVDEYLEFLEEIPDTLQLKWIDTHAHYDSKKINNNDLINKVFNSTGKIITLGTNTKTNLETLRLVSLNKDIYGMIGFFPNNAYEIEEDFVGKDANDNYLVFTKQLNNQKIVGIGEIGIDLYHNNFGVGKNQITGKRAIEYQVKHFRKQLDYAKYLDLPVSLHSRDAKELTSKILKDYKQIKGVMHCFSYDAETIKEYLDKGLYIGVGGTITYKNNTVLRDAIREVPLERILLETDAPYLTPHPCRGEVNNSSYIKYVIETLAEIKEISEEEIIKITNKNAYDLFKFGEIK